MSATSLPDRSSGLKKHNRNVSYNRTSLPRRTTKGPLEDAEDPLAADLPSTDSVISSGADSIAAEAVNIPVPSTPFSPERGYSIPSSSATAPSPSSNLIKPTPNLQSKDLSFLLRPSIYHTLPPPLLSSHPTQIPPPNTALPTLLAAHNYRAAATHCATRLSTPPTPPAVEILSLFYTRLACLVHLSFTQLAAAESLALDDPGSEFYRILEPTPHTQSGSSILPWHLRILVARLASIAHNDARRGVAAFYELAGEARRAAKASGDVAGEKKVWRQRLQECGLGVANVLIEAGDLEEAGRCLEGMRGKDRGNDAEVEEGNEGEGEVSLLNTRLALVYLALGDVDAARRCCGGSTLSRTSMLPVLTLIAEGKYDDAAAALRGIPQTELVQVNLAVCLFYMGRKEETVALLEGLVDQGSGERREVSFNLATCFELSCERAVGERKRELAQRVERGLRERGWEGERDAADFKL